MENKEIDKKKIAIRNRRRGRRNEKALVKWFLKHGIEAEDIGIKGKEDLRIRIKSKEFYAESKAIQRCVIEKWYHQAERNAKNRVPVVIIHITGKHHDNDFVIMKLKDFEELLCQ